MLEIYTAGFLDADGSVSLSKDRKDQPDYLRYPAVEFYNCDRGILEKIQERWGGGISARIPRNEKWNVSYELRLRGNAAYNLLTDVVPYMLHSKKGARAKLIVEHYKSCTPRNGKYTPDQIEKKKWLAEEIMSMTMRGAGAY